MPDGSKMDPLLAKAKPISDGGSTSAITYFRRGKRKIIKTKTAQQQLQLKREVRICERNNSADTKVSEEGGGGSAPGARTDSPAACDEDHGEAGCPLQPMQVNAGAEIHLQPVEDPTPEQGDAQRRL